VLTTDPDRAIDEFRLRVAVGGGGLPPQGLPERCQRAVEVAREVGAPLLAALDAAQAARDDERRAERAVAVASAQTRVVAGGLLLAPVLLVPGLGRLVGADLVGFYRSGLGLLVLGIGGGLLLLGASIVVLLVRRVGSARQGHPHPRPTRSIWVLAGIVGVVIHRISGPLLAVPAALLVVHLVSRRHPSAEPAVGVDEAADLIATALAAGTSGPEALRVTADRLPALAPRLRRLAFGLELGLEVGLEVDQVSEVGGRSAARAPRRTAPAPVRPRDPFRRLASLLAAAERTGAPVADSVRHLARDLRADDLARVLAAAERLPAQLTFPTALCLLPATVLLIGAPIVHAGLAAVGT